MPPPQVAAPPPRSRGVVVRGFWGCPPAPRPACGEGAPCKWHLEVLRGGVPEVALYCSYPYEMKMLLFIPPHPPTPVLLGVVNVAARGDRHLLRLPQPRSALGLLHGLFLSAQWSRRG